MSQMDSPDISNAFKNLKHCSIIISPEISTEVGPSCSSRCTVQRLFQQMLEIKVLLLGKRTVTFCLQDRKVYPVHWKKTSPSTACQWKVQLSFSSGRTHKLGLNHPLIVSNFLHYNGQIYDMLLSWNPGHVRITCIQISSKLNKFRENKTWKCWLFSLENLGVGFYLGTGMCFYPVCTFVMPVYMHPVCRCKTTHQLRRG